VDSVRTLGLLALLLRHRQPVVHGDLLDDEDAVMVEDLSDRLYLVPLGIDFYLTRFQRAGKGARQSPTGGRDDVIERCRVRRELLGVGAVVLGYLGVDPESDGVALGG
jgi:hypothetical protein